MMDYAQNATASQLNDRPSPALGQLKYASERVAIASSTIGAFVDRFHGAQANPATTATGQQPMPETYRNDIDTLFAQLDRLEGIVSALATIG